MRAASQLHDKRSNWTPSIKHQLKAAASLRFFRARDGSARAKSLLE
jgi:hypothetical protein